MRPPGGSQPPVRRAANPAELGVDSRPARDDAAAQGPRQRWRIVFRRGAAALRTGREDVQAWESALEASGLPVVGLDRLAGRPRVVLGATLPVGMAAERELLDIVLTRRVSLEAVRVALEGHLPPQHELVDLHDVWVGAPPLPGIVVGADYRARLAPDGPPPGEVAAAARRLLAADALPRARPKGTGAVRYDLRPLVDDVSVDAGPPALLRIRTRFHPLLGAGRPAEVLATLEELLARPLPVADVIRERLVTAEDE